MKNHKMSGGLFKTLAVAMCASLLTLGMNLGCSNKCCKGSNTASAKCCGKCASGAKCCCGGKGCDKCKKTTETKPATTTTTTGGK